MNGSMVIQSQLLATKFFVPSVSHAIVDRPRLSALLQKSLKHPLTIISAPAGFGKTTLLSTWIPSLSARHAPRQERAPAQRGTDDFDDYAEI